MSPSPRASARKKAKAAPAKPSPPFVAHQLVPPHEVLGEEESRRVLESLGVPPERLPKILSSDPGLKTDAKYQAARDAGERLGGRLVRIRRPSPTAGEAIAYRLLVAGLGE